MDIKQIVDKIPKEADINTREYTVADRVADVNTEYLFLIEYARQIGSNIAPTDGGDADEVFTLVQADEQTFTRTITDTSIVKVEYRLDNTQKWRCIDHDPKACENCYAYREMRFAANEKKIIVKDGIVGELRVTYDRPAITLFVEADYSDVTPPAPDWLPETFHPLLWLKPAMTKAGYYKKDRYSVLEAQYTNLFELFDNHYSRHSATDSEFEREPANRR